MCATPLRPGQTNSLAVCAACLPSPSLTQQDTAMGCSCGCAGVEASPAYQPHI